MQRECLEFRVKDLGLTEGLREGIQSQMGEGSFGTFGSGVFLKGMAFGVEGFVCLGCVFKGVGGVHKR